MYSKTCFITTVLTKLHPRYESVLGYKYENFREEISRNLGRKLYVFENLKIFREYLILVTVILDLDN